jgi:cation-transporting ATPase 13A3/4/5
MHAVCKGLREDDHIIIRSPCIFQNQQNLRDTVQSSDVATVWRGGHKYEKLPTKQLVPGDVIIIPPHGCDMHCDAVLLSGTCIVNESMLTGTGGGWGGGCVGTVSVVLIVHNYRSWYCCK